MMNRTNIIIIGILILLMAFQPSMAQREGKLGQVGLTFLDIPVGTRATGMGNAYIGLGKDITSIFWNPAGVAHVENLDFAWTYTSWIADIKHHSGAVGYNLGVWGVLGASLIMMDYGDIVGTRVLHADPGYEITGNLEPSNFMFGLTYAKKVSEKFSFGLNVKFVSEDLGKSMTGYTQESITEVENKVDALAFDLGTLFLTGYHDLSVAVSVRNFAGELKYRNERFSLPLTFTVGVAMDVFKLTNIGDLHILNIALDALHPRGYPERVNLGGEYWFNNLFAVRLGYKFVTDEDGLTAGLGINMPLVDTKIRLDYSYNDFGLFDAVHRMEIGFSL